MNFVLDHDYLLIKGKLSFLLIGKIQAPFNLFIETLSGEICQFLSYGELITISAPEGGDPRQAAILLELIRTYHAPLVVLPRGHPGSQRLNMVVSAGEYISLSCDIQRGTHPEQFLLCGSEEMAGIELSKSDNGVEISGLTDDHLVSVMHEILQIFGL